MVRLFFFVCVCAKNDSHVRLKTFIEIKSSRQSLKSWLGLAMICVIMSDQHVLTINKHHFACMNMKLEPFHI